MPRWDGRDPGSTSKKASGLTLLLYPLLLGLSRVGRGKERLHSVR